MTLKFYDKLSRNFIELLNDKDDYNVIIEVENKEKSFTAHSNILKYRSSYFRRELENIYPNKNNIKTITESRISAQIFETILKYIYGGIVNLENVETRFILDLMSATNEFEFEELSNELETYLINTKASWLKKHFSLVYGTVLGEKNFEKLENFCNDIVIKYPNLIFDADDFTSLPESILISILKKDNLQMKEAEIWNHVIKWGISQNPTLPTNLGEWSEQNIITLKTTLQQCLPYIRYFHLSANEVRDSIKPYKRILDKQLWKDIKYHLSFPKRQVKSNILPARYFSTIISEDHAAEISTWIDCNTTSYTLTNNPYRFELIFRGSRDGFAPQKFWNICHGHARTVVVVKVKETNEIIGGYNPFAWDNSNTKDQWMKTNDSFIFSLKNGNSIFSNVKDPKKAIHYIRKKFQNEYGPDFGCDFSMRSFRSNNFTLDNDCYCKQDGYEKPIRKLSPKYFSIVDYEVFKIIRKS
ncbi:hypothetical protein Glove_117g78 [Diversispora epigaea]|uniref:BTB domain-containing protein n=1 Tax=Diversispora epigaea TaxID=1348612 RepID=A0A397JA38_9GLOM|nr:hypothetical protein Glove_117g78 [Diversispora epigaea]